MIRTLLILLSFSSFASIIPSDHKGDVFPALQLTTQKKLTSKTILMGHYEIKDERGKRYYQQLDTRLRYRLMNNLKIGALFGVKLGDRHDNDWVQNNGWSWKGTNSREEFFYDLLISYRKILGANLRGDFDLNYETNLFNGHEVFKIAPRLIYFKTIWSLYTKYQIYFPLNFSEQTIYQKWLYLGGSWKVSRSIQIGPKLAYVTKYWSKSRDGKSRGIDNYIAEERSYYIGLKLMHQF